MQTIFNQLKEARHLSFLALVFFVMHVSPCNAQQIARQSIIRTDYLIYLPTEYESEAEKKWPLLIYLHGGLQTPTLEGLKQDFFSYQIEHGKKSPFIVVSPICNTGLWNTDILDVLLNDVIAGFRIDEDKVFLTGHSLGGYGTWEWAFDDPGKFAAIVPISGCSKEEDRDNAWKLRNMSIWIFHGDSDKVVEIDCNLEIAERLKNWGSNPKFTIYPNTGHQTWEQTYLNDELYQWLLKQDRKNNVPKSVQLKAETLKNYCGRYLMEGDTLTLSIHFDKLQVSMGKGRIRRLLAESETVFSFEKSPFLGISFMKKDGLVTGFQLLSSNEKIAVKID